MAPQIGNSRYIRFSSMTLQDVLVNSCSLNIEFLNTPWVVNSSGLMFDASACPNSTHNYLVDGATFDRVGMALYEGRLNCRDCNGVTIKNSIFTGIGSEASDGIQTQGNTRNITIGPNNQFSGILESLCGATHCDALQLQGGGTTLITQNYFKNGDTFIMSPDGCSTLFLITTRSLHPRWRSTQRPEDRRRPRPSPTTSSTRTRTSRLPTAQGAADARSVTTLQHRPSADWLDVQDARTPTTWEGRRLIRAAQHHRHGPDGN
jgi:hypothetical protein